MRTIYVGISHSANGTGAYVTLDTCPPPAYERAWYANGFDVVWRVDDTHNDQDAIAAVLMSFAGRYITSTVTRIYPPEPTAEERIEGARRVLRADYWDDVRGVVSDAEREIERRQLTDPDEVARYVGESAEGHQRVIYTGQAIEGLLYTDNEDAYYDEHGEWPTGDSIWSDLMRPAFLADILSTLGDVEDLIAEADPKCATCGESLGLGACDDPVEGELCGDCLDDAEPVQE